MARHQWIGRVRVGNSGGRDYPWLSRLPDRGAPDAVGPRNDVERLIGKAGDYGRQFDSAQWRRAGKRSAESARLRISPRISVGRWKSGLELSNWRRTT